MKPIRPAPRLRAPARVLFAACLAGFFSGLPDEACAQRLDLVDRAPFTHVLQGRVGFDDMAASPLPGTPYRARLPFKGAVFSTGFDGQVAILRDTGGVTHSANIRTPAAPLSARNGPSRYAELHLVADAQSDKGPFLASHMWVPGVTDDVQGFGTIAIAFSNRQFVFGFDLLPLQGSGTLPLVVRLQAYAVDGQPLGAPVILSQAGQVTFRLDSELRDIAGIELANLGWSGYAIDDIVFELPLVIGLR